MNWNRKYHYLVKDFKKYQVYAEILSTKTRLSERNKKGGHEEGKVIVAGSPVQARGTGATEDSAEIVGKVKDILEGPKLTVLLTQDISEALDLGRGSLYSSLYSPKAFPTTVPMPSNLILSRATSPLSRPLGVADNARNSGEVEFSTPRSDDSEDTSAIAVSTIKLTIANESAFSAILGRRRSKTVPTSFSPQTPQPPLEAFDQQKHSSPLRRHRSASTKSRTSQDFSIGSGSTGHSVKILDRVISVDHGLVP